MKSALLFVSLILFCCGSTDNSKTTEAALHQTNEKLSHISLPEGFKIEVYADKVENARSMSLSPSGTLFVGTRSKGNVYAIRDNDGDHRADEKHTLVRGWNMPNGVAFSNGDLYVAEVNRVSVFRNIEKHLANPPKPVIINDEYPTKKHHGWKYIAFGPDGKLYIPVGAPCNVCESKERIFNTITRINSDGSNLEIVHEGIRNTVGFTWHPKTGELWFTDNGRDWMGDDLPACELNRATKDGMHFGYPYCHQGDLPDPKLGKRNSCSKYEPPVQNLDPHVAPLGCEFIFSKMFPESYQGHILIAEHGSWNRSKPIGYRLTLVRLDDNGNALSYEVFADGWLGDDDFTNGRPVDLEWLPDGSLLVSDDYADMIYRIYYTG